MKGLIVFPRWDSILPPSALGLRSVWGPSDDSYLLGLCLFTFSPLLLAQCKLGFVRKPNWFLSPEPGSSSGGSLGAQDDQSAHTPLTMARRKWPG